MGCALTTRSSLPGLAPWRTGSGQRGESLVLMSADTDLNAAAAAESLALEIPSDDH